MKPKLKVTWRLIGEIMREAESETLREASTELSLKLCMGWEGTKKS